MFEKISGSTSITVSGHHAESGAVIVTPVDRQITLGHRREIEDEGQIHEDHVISRHVPIVHHRRSLDRDLLALHQGSVLGEFQEPGCFTGNGHEPEHAAAAGELVQDFPGLLRIAASQGVSHVVNSDRERFDEFVRQSDHSGVTGCGVCRGPRVVGGSALFRFVFQIGFNKLKKPAHFNRFGPYIVKTGGNGFILLARGRRGG